MVIRAIELHYLMVLVKLINADWTVSFSNLVRYVFKFNFADSEEVDGPLHFVFNPFVYHTLSPVIPVSSVLVVLIKVSYLNLVAVKFAKTVCKDAAPGK